MSKSTSPLGVTGDISGVKWVNVNQRYQKWKKSSFPKLYSKIWHIGANKQFARNRSSPLVEMTLIAYMVAERLLSPVAGDSFGV